jgi:hypothetical protein
MEPLPPPPALQVPPPAYRLHSPAGVAWACMGTPVAGGIMLALNYRKWGQKAAAAAAVVGGFVTTAIIVWLAIIVPASVPAIIFVVPQIVGGYFVAKWLQGRRVDAHVAANGRKASPWIGVAVGLGVTALVVGAVAIWFFSTGLNPRALIDSQESIDFGHGQYVFYSGGATRDDAQDFGEALVNGDFFDNTVPAEVLITGGPDAREISFPVAQGAWDDPATLDYMRQLTEYIAPNIGTKPITVLLLDENLYAKKRCVLADGWHCSPVA